MDKKIRVLCRVTTRHPHTGQPGIHWKLGSSVTWTMFWLVGDRLRHRTVFPFSCPAMLLFRLSRAGRYGSFRGAAHAYGERGTLKSRFSSPPAPPRHASPAPLPYPSRTRLSSNRSSMEHTKSTHESRTVRVVCISDTHNDDFTPDSIPYGDIFIHAGDLTDFGTYEEMEKAFGWISSLPHEVKVVIAGGPPEPSIPIWVENALLTLSCDWRQS